MEYGVAPSSPAPYHYFAQKVGIITTSPFGKLQDGNKTFDGTNGMYNNDRVGISNHGSLTGLMLASTYNDAVHPEYGLVFVQGPNTSSYNVWSISPDGPAKGSGLNFHYQAQATNIHSPANAKVVFQGSTGRVGIGTSSPTAKITLADHTTPEGGIKFRSAASTVSLYCSGSGNLTCAADFNTSGRVRIPGGNAPSDPDLGFSGASAGTGFSRAGQDITFITSATERMRISQYGSVSIKSPSSHIYAGQESSGATILCLLFPIASNGAHFTGTFISDNYDQPCSFQIAIADKYNNTSAIWAYGIKQFGNHGLDFVKYSYGSVNYVAIRMNSGSPTNREWAFTGNAASLNPTPVAYVASSVVSVLYSIAS